MDTYTDGHRWTIQAPPLCKGPTPIFRAWAASPHGRLPGTLWYCYCYAFWQDLADVRIAYSGLYFCYNNVINTILKVFYSQVALVGVKWGHQTKMWKYRTLHRLLLPVWHTILYYSYTSSIGKVISIFGILYQSFFTVMPSFVGTGPTLQDTDH